MKTPPYAKALPGMAAVLLLPLALAVTGCTMIPPNPMTSVVSTNPGNGGSDYVAPILPPPGLLYSDYKAPLSTRFRDIPVGTSVTKQSSDTVKSFIIPFILGGFIGFTWDEAMIQEIADEGGIEEIAYADYDFMTILSIYSELTINVYGN
jgi:hypothetical protein